MVSIISVSYYHNTYTIRYDTVKTVHYRAANSTYQYLLLHKSASDEYLSLVPIKAAFPTQPGNEAMNTNGLMLKAFCTCEN